jgi:hypothetical protein
MKETTKTTVSTDMVSTHGQMGNSMRDGG